MAEQPNEPLIRQGWIRAFVFFIFYVLVITGFSGLLQKLFAGRAEGGQVTLVFTYFLLAVCMLGIVWLFRSVVDKQPLYTLGFAWQRNSKQAAAGLLAAMAMLGTGTIVLMVTGHLNFTGINGEIKNLLLNLLLMLLVAFAEEAIFRGYLLHNLLRSFNKWLALGLSSVLFVVVHLGNEGAGFLPMLEIGIGGVMLGINYIFTRNLWFGIALHFAWNFLQGPVLGYEVSGLNLPSLLQQDTNGPVWLTGGAFGFEGSILAMVLNITLIVVLALVYQRQQADRFSA